MQIIQKLKDKKFRYILYSILMFSLLLWISSLIGRGELDSLAVFLLFAAAFLGTIYTQYTSLVDYKGLVVSLLPLGLALGTFSTLYYFPNFSYAFKLIGLLGVGLLFYLINLVNNILLVVEEKKEIIPLYRVAVTWSQILLIVVSIPLFTGIFKLNRGPVYQLTLVGGLTFIFTLYYFWSLHFDKRIRRISASELLINVLLAVFFVVAATSGISFIPAEDFLRALFSASVLLFSLNYLDAYMKNRINRGLLYQYGIIFLIFLLFVLIFRP